MDAVPVAFEAEFRGLKRLAGHFVNDDAQRIEWSESLLFEHLSDQGVVTEIPIGATAIDNAPGTLDWKSFTRGDRFQITGQVKLSRRGENPTLYIALESIEPLSASAKPVRTAS